uniref:CUB domain-containing protein n=1 Tax=Meloidogyne incognita TaxID=6306 RepID=A0A914MIN7_MELIC
MLLCGSNIDCSCPSEETFDSNLKEGVFKSPGFPGEYCGSLDCKWNILPDENTFIHAKLGPFATEKRYDILDVYQTRWNGSELLKVKQASVSGETFVDVWYERLTYTSSIGGGLFFHFVTDGHDHNAGFEIRFTRYPKDELNFLSSL